MRVLLIFSGVCLHAEKKICTASLLKISFMAKGTKCGIETETSVSQVEKEEYYDYYFYY